MIFGTKSYELTLVRDYVSRWGLPEAIRELLQNAIDSESPFVYSFKRTLDEGITLRLNSEFASLPAKTLLLGTTSKADSEDSIGSFGEGYKIALLVLTRLNYKVEVLNGHKIWTPRFRHSQKYDTELLVIDETDAPDKTNKGLTFVVHGLDEDDMNAIVESCLRMQSHIGAIKQTPKGDILLEKPGKLYVGGLFICNTGMHYGYNIKPQFLKLERDRQTVASWELAYLTKEMWFATEEFDKIAEMMEDGVPDLDQAEYGSPELVREACYKLFRKKHPGKVIVKNNEDMEKMVAAGMTVYVSGASFYGGVSSSKSYKSENHREITVRKPLQILKDWLAENRSEMRSKSIESFKKELLTESAKWRV